MIFDDLFFFLVEFLDFYKVLGAGALGLGGSRDAKGEGERLIGEVGDLAIKVLVVGLDGDGIIKGLVVGLDDDGAVFVVGLDDDGATGAIVAEHGGEGTVDELVVGRREARVIVHLVVDGDLFDEEMRR